MNISNHTATIKEKNTIKIKQYVPFMGDHLAVGDEPQRRKNPSTEANGQSLDSSHIEGFRLNEARC